MCKDALSNLQFEAPGWLIISPACTQYGTLQTAGLTLSGVYRRELLAEASTEITPVTGRYV